MQLIGSENKSQGEKKIASLQVQKIELTTSKILIDVVLRS